MQFGAENIISRILTNAKAENAQKVFFHRRLTKPTHRLGLVFFASLRQHHQRGQRARSFRHGASACNRDDDNDCFGGFAHSTADDDDDRRRWCLQHTTSADRTQREVHCYCCFSPAARPHTYPPFALVLDNPQNISLSSYTRRTPVNCMKSSFKFDGGRERRGAS